MATYTFTTPEIEEALILPTAIELGYKTKLESTESFSNQTEVPEWAINVQNFTQMDGSILYTYDIVTETDNTQTINEFMQEYFKTHFLREKILPAIVEVKTASLKAEKEAKEAELEATKKATEEYLIANA